MQKSYEHLEYTVDELREIENLPGNEHKRFELIAGVIQEHSTERIADYPSSSNDETVINLPAGLSAHGIEVVVSSPSNTHDEMMYKIRSYLRYGSRLVWVVHPQRKIVDVHRLDSAGNLVTQQLDINSTLDGEDVLPGFTLTVREIFPE